MIGHLGELCTNLGDLVSWVELLSQHLALFLTTQYICACQGLHFGFFKPLIGQVWREL
jgi:hypothetical protein